MVPIIYTTYGIAMGHRPEVLAASGGLQPAGRGRRCGRPAPVSRGTVWWWLNAVIARLRRQDVDGSAAGAQGMRAAVVPSNH
jgi:hypothetical protein